MIGLQALPSIAWLPLAILWFGLSERAILYVVVIGATPAIAIATANSVRQVPPILVRAGRSLGARRWVLTREVVLPAAVPGYWTGLQQGWAIAWRALLAGELVIATGALGLGHLLNQAWSQLDTLAAHRGDDRDHGRRACSSSCCSRWSTGASARAAGSRSATSRPPSGRSAPRLVREPVQGGRDLDAKRARATRVASRPRGARRDRASSLRSALVERRSGTAFAARRHDLFEQRARSLGRFVVSQREHVVVGRAEHLLSSRAASDFAAESFIIGRPSNSTSL